MTEAPITTDATGGKKADSDKVRLMENKSSTCSNQSINLEDESLTCKHMFGSLIDEIYVTESSLAEGIGYLDKEMTIPVRIEIDSRLTHKSE